MAAVLIVDDEAALARSVAALLAEEGYSVSIAGDGREALEQLAAARYDLILLDLMMPVMSGLELLRALQADSRLRSIPVVIMTSLRRDVAAALPEVGGRAILSKPFRAAELLTTVQRSLAS